MIDIVPAHTEEMLEPARQMMAELADTRGVDVGSGTFVTELLSLPGPYDPPRGRLVVAIEAAHLAGCAALLDAGEGGCEIRRLYVRLEYLDRGVERRLLSHLLDEAGSIGYGTAYADPQQSMKGSEDALTGVGFSAPSEDAGMWSLSL
jgi:GNAT superfamily N-acetyltransferase